MNILATIADIIKTTNDIQNVADQAAAESLVKLCAGNKVGAMVVLGGAIAANIALNVYLAKKLDQKGWTKTSKLITNTTKVGVAVNAPRYARMFEKIANV